MNFKNELVDLKLFTHVPFPSGKKTTSQISLKVNLYINYQQKINKKIIEWKMFY